MKQVHYGTNGKRDYHSGKTSIPTGNITGYVKENQAAITKNNKAKSKSLPIKPIENGYEKLPSKKMNTVNRSSSIFSPRLSQAAAKPQDKLAPIPWSNQIKNGF